MIPTTNFPEKRKILVQLAYQTNSGFTLIELLVSIVIIGVLAAVALPSYLNQAAKARGSEAKATLGSINRSQQTYRWENNIFASNISLLDIKVSPKFYNYLISGANTVTATAVTITQQDGLKASSAGITQNGDIFLQIVCEAKDTQLTNTTSVAPSVISGPSLTCPSGYNIVN
ncbi:MAG TPA: type IV pilin-like G/H family protein [Stenomitos sp.]